MTVESDVVLETVMALAWRQQGAFSVAQAEARKVTRSWISRANARGTIERRAPAVYVLAGTDDTARQRHMVQVLAAGEGSMVTADSALGFWCDEIDLPRLPQVAVPRSCGYRTGAATVWRSSDLHLAKPTVLDGVPSVGIARALLDASVGRTPDAVHRMIESCRRQRPLSPGALVEALRVHARPGRPGIAVYREALRSMRRVVTDSEFERLVLRDLDAAGVPAPEVHHVVRLPGEDPIEMDAAWPGARIDLELDGSDHIDRKAKARRDRHRDRLLQRAGWVVPRYTWDDYVCDRDGMIAEIGGFLDAQANP
jgi:Protein of unknown function (DUF559)